MTCYVPKLCSRRTKNGVTSKWVYFKYINALWSCSKLNLQLWLAPMWLPCDSPSRKSIYSWCTSTALLYYQKQAYIQLYITSNNISMMSSSSPIDSKLLQTSFSIWWLFCGSEILVALATKKDLVTVVYAGILIDNAQSMGYNWLKKNDEGTRWFDKSLEKRLWISLHNESLIT